MARDLPTPKPSDARPLNVGPAYRPGDRLERGLVLRCVAAEQPVQTLDVDPVRVAWHLDHLEQARYVDLRDGTARPRITDAGYDAALKTQGR